MASTTFLLYFILIALSSAQFVPQQIYSHADGAAIATGAVGGPSACRASLFILRNESAQQCLTTVNGTGTVQTDVCPAEVQGATALSCLGTACYVLNPAQKLIVVVSNSSTTVTFSIAALQNPTTFSTYQRNTTFAELYIVDGFDNSVWQFSVAYPTPTVVLSKKLTGLTIATPAGLFMRDTTTLLYASQGSTQISTYTVTTGAVGVWTPAPSFGNIQLISRDTYGNVHVYDASNQVIQIVYSTGTIRDTVSLIGTPRSFAQNRNKIFVIDENGITKYENEMTWTTSSTNATCMSIGATVTTTVTGGDYPYTIWVHPDLGLGSIPTTPGSVAINITAPPPPGYPATIMDEYQSRMTNLAGNVTTANRGFVDSSVFAAHTGNMSYMITFTKAYDQFIFTGSQSPYILITSRFFEYLEFWINVGDGGQDFTITFTPQGGPVDVKAGDLPLNTWYQFKFHVPTMVAQRGAKLASFTGFSIQCKGLHNGPNPIYLDSVRLYPYENPLPMRYVYAYDACNNYEQAIIDFHNETFLVNVDSTPVSCSVNSTISTNLTKDGVLFADTINGFGPFTYNWSYPNNNDSSSLASFPSMTSYITVYDNSLNKSWVDISLANNYSLNSTKRYRSAPHSIEFTPTAEGQGIIFQVSPEIDMNDYRTIEFWVNGGDVGGQTMWLYLIRSTQITTTFGGLFNTWSDGYIEIPPNEWIRLSFLLPTGSTVTKFNLIEFLGISPTVTGNSYPDSQPTIYIDDIVLLGKDVLSVVDSRGCVASTQRARILSPPLLTQSVTITNAKCYNSSDGSVSVTMGGGVPPYYFEWSASDGDSNSLLTGLPEAIVSVNASDANMCEYQPYTATILQPPALQVNFTISPPVCYGYKGLVSASASGGSGSYTYSWSSGASTRVIPEPAPDAIFLDSLAPGFSFLNSGQLCRGTGSHYDLAFSPSHAGYCSLQLQFDMSASEAGVVGCSLCLSMQKYSSIMFWIFADSDEALDNLGIAFTKGSLRGTEMLLSSLAPLSGNMWNKVSVNLTEVNGTSPDGFVLVSPTPNGMGTVILDDVVVVPLAANGAGYSAYPGFQSTVEVVASTYFITIVDGNGCSFSSQVEVPQPDAIEIKYNSTNASSGNADGSITIEVSGGNPPYSYWWVELNDTSENVSNLAYGQYTLRVTDTNGCSAEMSILVNLSEGPAEIRKYNAALSSGLAALVSVGVLICIFSACMLGLWWTQFSTLGSFLSSLMVVGCITSLLSALVLLPDPTDTLCTAFPWLLGIGFVLVYGCLFVKTWALYQVWRKAIHYQKASLTPGYILRCLGLALAVEIVFLIIWTVIDPPKVHLVKVVNNTLERQCDTNHVTFWVIFLAVKGAWLIFGAVLSVLSRNIVKEYNESSSIAYAIYNNVLLGAIAIPLAILIKEVPGGRLTVEVVIISLAFIFTMVVVFFKTWHTILMPDKINLDKMSSGSKRSKNSSGSSGGNSKTTKESSSRVSNSATDSSP